jgi:phage terminase Nu1 subunit (DNA packaging protein)
MGRTKTQDAFSITGASDILNRATRTISKALQRSGAKPSVVDHGVKKWRLAVIIDALDKHSEAPINAASAPAGAKAGHGADGSGRLDLSSERAKLAVEQTEAARMKNAITAGEYVAVKGAVDDCDRFIFRPMREIILCIPGKCSDAVAMHSELDREAVFEIINRECRQALTLMSMIGGIIDDQAKHAGASQPEEKTATRQPDHQHENRCTDRQNPRR